MAVEFGFWEAGLEGTVERMNACLLLWGPKADFPAPALKGRLAFATDEHQLYYDTGSEWLLVTPRFASIFGDGSDGDAVISSDSYLGRDMFYNSLTVNEGVTLTVNNHWVFVKDTLTVNGTIKASANSGGNGGPGYAGIGGAGGNGGVGAGIVVICARNIVINSGGAITAEGEDGQPGGDANPDYQAGGGGGGGGGAGGFICLVYSTLVNNGTISANGGAGGSGGARGTGSGTGSGSGTAGSPGAASIFEGATYDAAGVGSGGIGPGGGGGGGGGGFKGNGGSGGSGSPTGNGGNGYRGSPHFRAYPELVKALVDGDTGGGGGSGGGGGGLGEANSTDGGNGGDGADGWILYLPMV